MKIHIFGCSGSGKTRLAKRLAKEYNLPHFDLDELFWDNSNGACNVKNTIEKRNEMLSGILNKNDWIIEGVYYSWLEDSFNAADRIIFLDVPLPLCKARIVKRFIKRKLGLEPGKKETIKVVKSLLKWTTHFVNTNVPQALAMLKPQQGKTVVLKTKRQINLYKL